MLKSIFKGLSTIVELKKITLFLGCCHTSAASEWKQNAIHGFYDRKVTDDEHIYYVRESTTRGRGNPYWYPPGEEPKVVTPVPIRVPTPEPTVCVEPVPTPEPTPVPTPKELTPVPTPEPTPVPTPEPSDSEEESDCEMNIITPVAEVAREVESESEPEVEPVELPTPKELTPVPTPEPTPEPVVYRFVKQLDHFSYRSNRVDIPCAVP